MLILYPLFTLYILFYIFYMHSLAKPVYTPRTDSPNADLEDLKFG